MPKISVIMGVYNCKNPEILNKSIESIIQQTYTDWELLVCNDGSTDNTLNYLLEIKKKDSRIKIFSYERNKGLSAALNICLRKAKGEYIARQDDDDISKPDRFEEQLSFLENHPQYAIVGTLADVYDDYGIWGEYKLEEKPTKKSFYWNSPFMHPTIMMRTNILKECGGYRIAKETRRCEDFDLFMRMYSLGYRGYNLQKKLYTYRLVNDPRKKYRPMKYRIDEAVVRFQGYKAMGVLKGGLLFVCKPILIGLIPQKILYKIKRTRY
ncbi:MAG TPA: beta(1,3)galactosyltransferase EpsH [Lachnospiraceae bacterium]|nr:beta(1,3)galactosyltransferase EpsH [Lachnospiraceae bacterium]